MKEHLIKILVCYLLLLPGSKVEARNIQEEKVFVHLNKTLAAAGETLWFSLRIVNTVGEPYSKIAYGELIDREGKAVHQAIFSVDSGILQGTFDIPDQLVSDHYLLRFYTRTSPLIGPEGVDSQLITIINPKRPNPNEDNPKSSTPNFSLDQAQLNGEIISLRSIEKKEEISLNLAAYRDENIQLSASIQNQILPDNFQGRMNGGIYKPLSENSKWIPEPYGHVVYGKNLDTEVDTTETFYLSAHGSQSVLNTAKPKPNGDLFFDLGPLKDYDYFIIQSSNWEEQLNFSIQSPFWDLKFKEQFAFPPFQISGNEKSILMNVILSAQLNTYFYIPAKEPFHPIVTGFVADKTYYLDDYNRFEKIETVLREYVPEVHVRKQNKKTLFKVLNNPLGTIFDENPLLIIDAMPVFDTDILSGFDPEKIQKLEILAREFYLNEDRFSGVMSFSSYENDFGGFPLPTTALYLNYPTIQVPKILQSPNYNPHLSEPNYPDFRTALHWSFEEHSKPESTQITTSQISGNYELKISYINENGEFVMVKDYFQVAD